MRPKNVITLCIIVFVLSGLLVNSVFAMPIDPEKEIVPVQSARETNKSLVQENTDPPEVSTGSTFYRKIDRISSYSDKFRPPVPVNDVNASLVPALNSFDSSLEVVDFVQDTAQGSSPWQQLNQDGFGDNNFLIPSVQEFNGYLYAGTWKNVDEVISAEVWRSDDGSSWEKVDERARNGCADLIVFDAYLYCGSWDGVIWRTSDGTSWTEVVTDGFGDSNNGIARFAVFNNMLYAGTWNSITGTQIWRTSDGTNWTKFGDGLDPNDIVVGAISTEEFGGYLYWGTANWETGAQLWRTDGTTLTQMTTGTSPAISSLAAFDGNLYAGVWDNTSTQVWRSSNGSDWLHLLTFSDLGSGIREANGLEVYDGRLYLVGTNPDTGLEVWQTSNGLDWGQVGFVGFGDPNNYMSFWDNAITTFEGKLIVSTNNHNTGGEVWAYAPNDYEVYDVGMWLNLGVKDWIWGHAIPGSIVTIITPRDTIETYADPSCNGCFGINEPIEINPGDTIMVTAGPESYPVDFTVPTPLIVNADSTTEQVTGQIGGWDTQTVAIHGWWENGDQEVTSDASGNFGATFSDIPRGGDGYIHFPTVEDEADINFHQHFRTPDLVMDIFPFADQIEGQYAPGHSIVLTVYDSDDNFKAEATVTTGEIDWWGDRTGFATQMDDAYWVPSKPDIVPGDKIYGLVDGGPHQSYAQVGEITGNVDISTDSISGTIDAPWLIPDPGLLDVECYPWGAPDGVPDKYSSAIPDGDPAHTYTCAWDPFTEWDVEANQWIGVAYRDPQANRIIEGFYEADNTLYLNVNYDHDWIEGQYPAGYEVTLTVTESDGLTLKGTTTLTTVEVPWWGGQTGFSTNMDGVVWDPPERPDIQPGDWVFGQVTVEGTTYYAQVQLGTFSGVFSAEANAYTGTLSVPWLDPEVPVPVQCHPWGAPGGTNSRETTVLPDGSSEFSCDWTGEWDVQPGQQIAVLYLDPGGHWVYSVPIAYTDELILFIHYDHEWIDGYYEADHEIFLSVLDGFGVEKANITLTSGYIDGWGSSTGFSTNMEGATWHPNRPDIQPGDTIYGEVDGGTFTAQVTIGTVTADLDFDSDQVSGTVDAEWLPQGQEIKVSCEIWVWNSPPGKEDWVLPTGSDPYLCDWTDDGYDLDETSNLMVGYYDPDGHKLTGDFRYPAPQLRIEKWLEGGEPGEGGNVTFNIQYRNEGNGPAVNAIITDTLVQGLTYLGDTSGLPKTVDGNQVIWQLGDLAPGDWITFYVFAHVEATEGNDIINTAVISSDGFDSGNEQERTRTWQGTVIANNTHVNVGKGTWTILPAPGQNYVYNINVCNNGPTGSTELTLTETLPDAVTLVSWWGREAGWSFVSYVDNILTLEYPSIPGGTCREVYVKVNLDPDAQPNDQIVNLVEIYAENDDTEWLDNESWLYHNVGSPFKDLSVRLDWHWGVLAPGGQYRFIILFYNEGNIPVEGPLSMTLTLPSGVHFSSWSHWDWANFIGEPVVDGNTVTWLVDDLDPGYYDNISVIVNIDSSVAPGTELIHEVTFEVQPEETNIENNHATMSLIVYDHGPNLRIRKVGGWAGGYDDGQYAWYRLVIENIGDETVENVEIRDDFPTDMTFADTLRVNHNGQWTWDDSHLDEHYFTASLDRLEPGWAGNIDFDTRIPWETLQNGASYENFASIGPIEGDTNPVDNTASVIYTVGPDIFIQKSLQSGDFLPGANLTYRLDFGNLWGERLLGRTMSGNTIITDTLPEGMSYVAGSAQVLWPGQEWTPSEPMVDGQVLTWTFGPLHTDQGHVLIYDVLLAEEISEGNPLINTAVVSSDDPENDVDPFMENNTSVYTGIVEVVTRYLYLPLILK